MKNIFIGLLIIFVTFLVIDFIYTTKNTCVVADQYETNSYACGIIKKQMNFDIFFFNRYW